MSRIVLTRGNKTYNAVQCRFPVIVFPFKYWLSSLTDSLIDADAVFPDKLKALQLVQCFREFPSGFCGVEKTSLLPLCLSSFVIQHSAVIHLKITIYVKVLRYLLKNKSSFSIC